MKPYTLMAIAACGLLSVPSLSLSQDQPVTGEKIVTFPQSYKCSTNSPCRNITGEILQIEESYLIQGPDGEATNVKVTRETKMDQVPKVGDNIAAQLRSTGEANAIVKLAESPKRTELSLPSHSQKDLRDSTQPAGSGQADERSDR